MKRTAVTAVTALSVVTLAAALTACGAAAEAPKEITATAPASSAAEPSAQPGADKGADAGSGIPPKPDAATQAAFVSALDAIDPEIVNGKADKAVSRGRNQCETIHNFPKDKQKQIDLTNQRFTSPKHPDGFGTEKAAKILEAVRTNLCPKS